MCYEILWFSWKLVLRCIITESNVGHYSYVTSRKHEVRARCSKPYFIFWSEFQVLQKSLITNRYCVSVQFLYPRRKWSFMYHNTGKSYKSVFNWKICLTQMVACSEKFFKKYPSALRLEHGLYSVSERRKRNDVVWDFKQRALWNQYWTYHLFSVAWWIYKASVRLINASALC